MRQSIHPLENGDGPATAGSDSKLARTNVRVALRCRPPRHRQVQERQSGWWWSPGQGLKGKGLPLRGWYCPCIEVHWSSCPSFRWLVSGWLPSYWWSTVVCSLLGWWRRLAVRKRRSKRFVFGFTRKMLRWYVRFTHTTICCIIYRKIRFPVSLIRHWTWNDERWRKTKNLVVTKEFAKNSSLY